MAENEHDCQYLIRVIPGMGKCGLIADDKMHPIFDHCADVQLGCSVREASLKVENKRLTTELELIREERDDITSDYLEECYGHQDTGEKLLLAQMRVSELDAEVLQRHIIAGKLVDESHFQKVRIGELERALEPFAKAADYVDSEVDPDTPFSYYSDHAGILVADVKAARAALRSDAHPRGCNCGQCPSPPNGPYTEPEGTPPEAAKDAYQELIMSIGNKHPGESRHETALRYIRSAEQTVYGKDAQEVGEDGRE